MPTESKIVEIESLLKQLEQRRRTPVSTYRIQFHRGFGFRQAAEVIPYLAQLGITDFYSSPFLKAHPGSTHGYDICDHNSLNPELGFDPDYSSFIDALQAHQMGHILDFVPNHMGVDAQMNPWWHDVLENGQGSAYSRYFDIHWNPIKPELKGKVLLPILGGPYGVVLEDGRIDLDFENPNFVIRYYDHRLPVDPKQYSRILRHGLEDIKIELANDPPVLREFLSIVTAFANLPANNETSPDRVAERQREKTVTQERLEKLVTSSDEVRDHIQTAIVFFNGQKGQPDSFNALHDLLEAQAYRLAYWKTAFHEINYRRFFDINSLAALRVENPAVFRSIHRLIMTQIVDGQITGLRIDHPDGLFDPAGYFEGVQDLFLQQWVRHALPEPDEQENARRQEIIRDWRIAERKKDPKGLGARPLYVVAEKILSPGETLDAHWAIDGTSGYDFLHHANGLFIDSKNAQRMLEVYTQFTGKKIPFDLLAYVCKKLIMSTSLASELNVLAHSLNEITEHDRRSRDFTLDSLRDALKEVIACFPVYRTYINTSRGGATDRDIIARAVNEAKIRNPALEPTIFEFVQSVLTPDNADKVSSEHFRRQLGFTMKFQQYTSPVQAKGIEDTAFYRYNVLLSLNEVGGSPKRFGITTSQFHSANLHLHQDWPYALSATSTHDTKRGEDARVRLSVLSEIPDVWEDEVTKWASMNKDSHTELNDQPAPDRNDEYLFYQSLLGAWSTERSVEERKQLSDRLKSYMLKAVKEAKLHTSWVAPNEAYENAVGLFVERTLTGEHSQEFFDHFVQFAERIGRLGMLNSLSQTVLKIASPGVPDFYQGCELWDFSLVDPDNRRPVDYAERRDVLSRVEPLASQALNDVQRIWPAASERAPVTVPEAMDRIKSNILLDWLNHWHDGAIKLYVTTCGLRLRKLYPNIFLEGDYLPLETRGHANSHLVAFARRNKNQVLLIVVPRLITALLASRESLPIGLDAWQDTRILLPPDIEPELWIDVLTQNTVRPALGADHSIRAADLLTACPVGIYAATL